MNKIGINGVRMCPLIIIFKFIVININYRNINK